MIDSLEKALPQSTDTMRVVTHNRLSKLYLVRDVKIAQKHAKEALRLSTKLEYLYGTIDAMNNLAATYSDLSNYDSTRVYIDKALELCIPTTYKQLLSDIYLNAGNLYQNTGDYSKAIEYFLLGLKISEELGNADAQCRFLVNTGNSYALQEKNAAAKQCYNRVLEMKDIVQNKTIMTYVSGGLANIYFKEENYGKALETHILCKKYALELDDKINIATSIENIGNDYVALKDYENAERQFNEAYELCKSIDDTEGLASISMSIGRMYIQRKLYDAAIGKFSDGLNYSKQIGAKDYIKEAYNGLAESYSKKGDYKTAFDYTTSFMKMKDSILNEKSDKEIAAFQTLYETEKKEKTIGLMSKEILLREQREGRQRIFNYSLALFSFLMIVLGSLIYNGYRNKKRSANILQNKNDEISQQNIEIENQRSVLENKNTLITDSINYAQRIQASVLHDHIELKKCFRESFIYFAPKDIVSGDFFWMHEINETVLVSVVDCTGHGVPGAFMSIVANDLLNDIAARSNSVDTAFILDQLNNEVVKTIKQPENEAVKDGMDLALCAIDRKNLKLSYSGAKNPAYIISMGVLHELKADKISIGGANGKHFTSKEFDLKKGDMIYLFSDGYVDQKGGKDNTKFYYDTFRALLTEISALTVSEQEKKLLSVMNDWKGNRAQLDDIMIMGIQII